MSDSENIAAPVDYSNHQRNIDRVRRGGLLSLFDTAQEGVALLPGRLLHAPAVALRSAGHIGRALAQGHAQAAAQLTAERRVVPGGGPQAVVEVRRHHP